MSLWWLADTKYIDLKCISWRCVCFRISSPLLRTDHFHQEAEHHILLFWWNHLPLIGKSTYSRDKLPEINKNSKRVSLPLLLGRRICHRLCDLQLHSNYILNKDSYFMWLLSRWHLCSRIIFLRFLIYINPKLRQCAEAELVGLTKVMALSFGSNLSLSNSPDADWPCRCWSERLHVGFKHSVSTKGWRRSFLQTTKASCFTSCFTF